MRLEASGICGTDLEKIEGGLGPRGILGHEVSGTVERVGGEVKSVGPGDRVIAHHHVPCHNCHYCSKDDYTMCEFFKQTNFDPCGLAEYFRVPYANVERGGVVKIPDSVGFDEAALVEPTACCLRAIKTVGIQEGDNALVIGLGPTGLTHIQLLRHFGAASVIGTDVSCMRLEMARKLGANITLDPTREDLKETVRKTSNVGVDLAIVATGNPKALSQALNSVRKGGRICLFGAPPIGSKYEVDLHDLFNRQVRIVPSYSCVEDEIHETLKLLTEKKIDLMRLITNRYALREAPLALEHARMASSTIKTLITR